MFDKIIRYEFTLNDLNYWEFCNVEDGKTVMHYLEQNKRLEYSKNKLNEKGKVFIFINNKPQHIADIKPKI